MAAASSLACTAENETFAANFPLNVAFQLAPFSIPSLSLLQLKWVCNLNAVGVDLERLVIVESVALLFYDAQMTI